MLSVSLTKPFNLGFLSLPHLLKKAASIRPGEDIFVAAGGFFAKI